LLAAIESQYYNIGIQELTKMQFEVEIVDTTARENYNKVVIHKKKCVPCGPESKMVLGRHVSQNNNFQRPDVPQKTRPKLPPKVPPKPFLLTRGHDTNTKQVSPPSSVSLVPRMCPDSPIVRPPPGSVGGGDNCNGHLKERLIEETKSIVEKNLHKERNELIVRMQKKVNFLKEDQAEIKSDLDANSSLVSDFIEKVKSDGNMIDADKLRLHVDELESVTSLMTVLRVRLKTTENKLEVTKDQRDKEYLGNKVIKLSSQVQEAEALLVFRRRRGDILFQAMSSYLDTASLSKLRTTLTQRSSLRAELSEVEEKLHLALRQIEALKI